MLQFFFGNDERVIRNIFCEGNVPQFVSHTGSKNRLSVSATCLGKAAREPYHLYYSLCITVIELRSLISCENAVHVLTYIICSK